MLQNYPGLGVGRHKIMDLPRSMYAVYFSVNDAMVRESHKLQLRLRVEDLHATEEANNVNFYSIRSYDGAPHVMIKTLNDAVVWCRGVHGSRPAEYIRQIVTFIVQKDLDVMGDMACTGIIKQKGKYYNIYDLPKNFIYNGSMDLSYAGLTQLPDMRTVTIHGDYDISGNRLTRFEGAPLKVDGDFIIVDNENPYLFRNKPQFTKIGGAFRNGMAEKHR